MKSPFQDIIPPERRSIRNITLNGSKPKEDVVNDAPEASVVRDIKPKRKKILKPEDFEEEKMVFRGKRKFGLSNLVLWGITLVSVIAVFLVLTHFLNTATIHIETKSWQIDLPSKLNLSLQPQNGKVGYSTVVLTDSVSDTMSATGEKEVSTKSTGTIIIYNNFSTDAQRLVVGTRFESSKGLIYKLDKAVVVPGIKKVSGKNAPGSIEATVTAEKAGKEHNISLDDFTVPGFKGSAKYDKVYARSKTSMTGGDVGKVATVAPQDLDKKVADIKSKLDLKLKDKAIKELPQDQVIIEGLSKTEYKVGSPKLQGENAVVEVTASMKVYLLDSNTLASQLLSPQKVNVLPTDEFLFVTTDAKGTLASTTDSAEGISFEGKVKVGYNFDAEKFKTEVAGVSSDEIPNIASKYPAISKISTTIKPFWKSSLPNDVSKISVVMK